jgi:hypothetical protein
LARLNPIEALLLQTTLSFKTSFDFFFKKGHQRLFKPLYESDGDTQLPKTPSPTPPLNRIMASAYPLLGEISPKIRVKNALGCTSTEKTLF